MTTSMPVLANPYGPQSAADRLARRVGVSNDMRPSFAKVLARWLAQNHDCRTAASTPGAEWTAAAQRAYADGQPVELFRLRRTVTKEAIEPVGKWLRRAERHAEAHPDDAVRHKARKLIRALADHRLTWSQLTERLEELRSDLNRSGRRRALVTPVRRPEVIEGAQGKTWIEVTTPKELGALGQEGSLCTALSHPRGPSYIRALKSGETRFFKLTDNATGEFFALVSIDVYSETVEEARGKNNALLKAYRGSLKKLIKSLGVTVGDARDLVGIGLADGFLKADLRTPDLTRGNTKIWFGDDGSRLFRIRDSWSVLRRMNDDHFVLIPGSGCEHDADDLLGAVLTRPMDK